MSIKVSKRRRRERKTNYEKRIKLLKSSKPRIVIRKSNKYITIQYIESKEAKDKILYGISSRKLMQFGWPKEWQGSLKSMPACYLTGFLFGKKILDKVGKKIEAVIDMGLIRNVTKSRIYAIMKGIKDAGVEIFQSEENFPSDERIKGEHIKKNIEKIFNEIIIKIKNF